MNNARRFLLTIVMLAAALTDAYPVWAQPVITDSRIKTFVYNENDVYQMLTHHGYQAHIEFGQKEKIRTISVGDRVSWRVIPDGRRLFVRSVLPGAHTNMTVVTNERTYEFDLQATDGGRLKAKEDLVYRVRFYYPDEHIPESATAGLPPIYSDEVTASVQPANAQRNKQPELPELNFNYTYTGPDAKVPSRIFDDGSATYFELKERADIYVMGPDGTNRQLPTVPTSDGFTKAGIVAGEFMIRYPDGSKVRIFNEMISGNKPGTRQ